MPTVRAVIGTLFCLSLWLSAAAPGIAAQIDRDTRDRVVPAAVEVAAAVLWEDEGFSFTFPMPVGSGTIVTAEGLILTNHHVVADPELARVVDSWNSAVDTEFPGAKVSLVPDRYLILTSDGVNEPVESYTAVVVAEDAQLDLAVMRITADAAGNVDAVAGVRFPFVPPGDSSAMGLGDRVHVFSYPSIGGDALTYTPGVVSGFQRQEGITGVAWITTDAVMSGGSSGGTAVNDAGELIGIPTQGSELDCRPGDTNRDGVVDVNDIGCIPTGGSLGQLRPVNQALPLLERAASSATPDLNQQTASTTPTPAQTQTGTLQLGEPDLPLLALAPADVAAAGLEDFVVDWSQMIDQRGVPAMVGFDDTWQDRLQETNLERVYLLALLRPQEPGPATSITSTIWQYPTSADAASGFAFTEQELEATYGIADLPAAAFGDESELSSWQYADSATGEAMVAFEATARLGDLVGTVRVGGPVANDQALQADALRLGALLADRLATAASVPDPLSARVVRVTDQGVGGTADFYLLRDGEAVPTRWYQEPDGAAAWADYWRSIGVTDGYETEIYLPVAARPSPARVGVRVYEFDTSANAADFVRTYGADLESVVTGLTEVPGALVFGDESATYAFQTDWWPDVDPEYRVVAVMRAGTSVATVEVAATQPIPAGVVRTIASAQAACLTSGCPSLTMNAPAWLLALPAPESGDSGAATQATASQAATADAPPTATAPPLPSPTPFPTPEPTATPTPEPPPDDWGLYQEFDDPDVIDTSNTDVSTWEITDGVLRLAITEPGSIDGLTMGAWPTDGRNAALTAGISDTRGWGEIMLWMITDDDAAEWHFAVDPVARQWSLYRASTTSSDLFYWVEPRPLPADVGDEISQIEVWLAFGEPMLFVNGVDVVGASGVAMPEIMGSVTFGFGAGVNPGSLSGAGEYFSVDFDYVALTEIPG